MTHAADREERLYTVRVHRARAQVGTESCLRELRVSLTVPVDEPAGASVLRKLPVPILPHAALTAAAQG